jgi:hypothetical protein
MSLPKLPSCRLLIPGGLLTLLTLLAPLAGADDKPKAPAGTWDRKEGQGRIEFADKGVLKILPHGDKADVTIVCSYAAGKDGVLKVKITDHEGADALKAKLKDRLPTGTEFSFKWKPDGDTAALEDLEGKEVEGLKGHFEGKYEKAK